MHYFTSIITKIVRFVKIYPATSTIFPSTIPPVTSPFTFRLVLASQPVSKHTTESGKILKPIIPSSLILTIAIILDRLAVSSTQISIAQSLRALCLLFFSTLILMLIIQYFVRDWQRTDFIVLMIPIAFVVYRSTYSFLKTNFLPQATVLGIILIAVIGLLYAVVVRRKTWESIRNPARISAYFNFVFAVLFVFQLVRVGQDSRRAFTSLDHASTPAIAAMGSELRLQSELPPDIYVIVLDGYARQDVLQILYRHDNSDFIHQLEERGFYVASDSHSNYTQTPYTMASFWNFDYIQPWDEASEYTRYLYQPIQNNRVFRALDAIGYTTVSFQGEANFTEIRNADIYLSNFLPLNDFETFLLIDSPLEPLSNIFDLGIPVLSYKTHRQRTLYQLETLQHIPAELPGPKIVYAHIINPHPPFVFYRDGTIREPLLPYTLAEGVGLQGGREVYQAGYPEQVKFINKEILAVIDAILLKSSRPPVILLMGDHGPASMFNWDPQAPGCLYERTSNLYAMLLPGHENDGTLHSSITPVNTFRVIFNTYFGTDLPLLEDRSYLMYWYEPTLNMDITMESKSLAGCTDYDK